MGDVTGHGVTAGAAIVRLHVAVLADALAGLGPADVVKRVDTLPDQLRTGEIATMVYVVADPRARQAGGGQRRAPATGPHRAQRRSAPA